MPHLFRNSTFCLLLFLSLLLAATACKKKEPNYQPQSNTQKIKKIEESHPIRIYRYEQALFSLSTENLKEGLDSLQKDYHFFLGDNPSTSDLKKYLNDPLNKRLYKEVQQQYADLSDLEEDFQKAFARIRYYFPDAELPRIYTIVSGLSYETPVIYVDSVLIISLDMYMGSDYHYYKQMGEMLPLFIRRHLNRENILPDCMKALSYQVIHSNNAALNILDDMVLEGKRWMFAEIALPECPDSLICNYTTDQMEWAKAYEYDVWSFLINKNYLYTNDNLVARKLIGEAPFTAYFGERSPGNLGSWLGWQICRHWVLQNQEHPMKELFEEKNPQTVLKNSKYRPTKKQNEK